MTARANWFPAQSVASQWNDCEQQTLILELLGQELLKLLIYPGFSSLTNNKEVN